MRFGPVAPADAIGGVVVHTIRRGKVILKKGTAIGPVEVEALAAAGVNQVVIAALDKGDVSEDVAAASIAEEPGTTVTLSYRGDAFARAKAKNRERFDAGVAAGRIRVLACQAVLA